jgi:hypothetical protein
MLKALQRTGLRGRRLRVIPSHRADSIGSEVCSGATPPLAWLLGLNMQKTKNSRQ